MPRPLWKKPGKKWAVPSGRKPREIVFTSGASEANNLAIKGAAPLCEKKEIISSHQPSNISPCWQPAKRLSTDGWEVTVVQPDDTGYVSAESVLDAITDRTVLVSIIAANNEVGTLNSIREIGQICRSRRILFHTDATQAVGKVPVDVESDCIDLMSFSAHKIYGPKGVGALYVRRRGSPVKLVPLRTAADTNAASAAVQSPFRSSPVSAGRSKSPSLSAKPRLSGSFAFVSGCETGFRIESTDVRVNGHPTLRLPGNLNMSFSFVDGEALMMAMRDVAVSSGSACTSANPEPSHVLMAIGLDEDAARSSLRFGLGRYNTEEEVDFTIDAVVDAVERLRYPQRRMDRTRRALRPQLTLSISNLNRPIGAD